MRAPEDPELVERAKRDPEAFGVLYDRYFARIYRFVYSRVRNQRLAEAVTAEIFFKALRHIRWYTNLDGPFSSWLRTMAVMTRGLRRHSPKPRRQSPPTDNGFQPTGCPAPLLPRLPTLSAAAAVPLPPVDDGPGIVYALGH